MKATTNQDIILVVDGKNGIDRTHELFHLTEQGYNVYSDYKNYCFFSRLSLEETEKQVRGQYDIRLKVAELKRTEVTREEYEKTRVGFVKNSKLAEARKKSKAQKKARKANR